MRFGYIGAAAAALCAAVPAQAVVTVQVDAYATGTADRFETACGGLCSSTPTARDFSFSLAVDLAEGASTNFQFGPNSNDGIRSGTITRNGYDMYGAVYYVGSNFLFKQTQQLFSGVIDTRLTAGSFTVRQIIPAPVPEPTTWALMILGFGMAGWAMRRQKTKLAFS